MNAHSRLSERLHIALWGQPLDGLPDWKIKLIWSGRLLYALARDMTRSNLSLHAMSLVYTTLLSLVPLLAVSFSVLKGFGVHNQIEPLLGNVLSPLGTNGREITTKIIGFVDNMQVGVLGSVGLAMLLYTVISLIQKIEQAFNYAWRVTDVRPFAQRFPQYLSLLTLGPVLFFSALGLSASLGNNQFVQSVMHMAPMGVLMETLSLVAPYLMISLTFAFVYLFVPSTRVHLSSAILGALIAGLLWESVGSLFGKVMAGSTQYTAIYSSLAILILFMIWVYLGWLILLIGTTIAFYHQNPEYLATRDRDARLSNRVRERLALAIGVSIAERYLKGEPPPNAEMLAKQLRLARNQVACMLEILQRTHTILPTVPDDPPSYVLARAPEGIGIKDLLDAVRAFEEGNGRYREPAQSEAVREIESRIDAALADSLRGITLRDLAAAETTAPPVSPHP